MLTRNSEEKFNNLTQYINTVVHLLLPYTADFCVDKMLVFYELLKQLPRNQEGLLKISHKRTADVVVGRVL